MFSYRMLAVPITPFLSMKNPKKDIRRVYANISNDQIRAKVKANRTGN